MTQRKVFCLLLCLFSVLFILIGGCLQNIVGCLQENIISGEYLNEGNDLLNNQYIIFHEGNFTHVNYNNTPNDIRMGTFSANKTILIMYYNGGETIEFYISGNEIIPVNEDSTLPMKIRSNYRFLKKIRQC